MPAIATNCVGSCDAVSLGEFAYSSTPYTSVEVSVPFPFGYVTLNVEMSDRGPRVISPCSSVCSRIPFFENSVVFRHRKWNANVHTCPEITSPDFPKMHSTYPRFASCRTADATICFVPSIPFTRNVFSACTSCFRPRSEWIVTIPFTEMDRELSFSGMSYSMTVRPDEVNARLSMVVVVGIDSTSTAVIVAVTC